MGWDNPTFWPAMALVLALAALLVAAGVEDARSREIANWKNAAIALLAPVWWWASGMAPWPDAALQLATGLLVFAVFAGVFFAGWMGGGDVKMIGALALWMPLPLLVQFLMVMSLVGGGLTVAMMIDRHLRKRSTIEVPYGVAIAIAGLLSLGKPDFNQFL